MLHVMLEDRSVRAHRERMSRDSQTDQQALSRGKCLAAARTILSLLELARMHCPTSLVHPSMHSSGFRASLVIFMELMRSPSVEAKRVLQDALVTLRCAKVSVDALRRREAASDAFVCTTTEYRQQEVAWLLRPPIC